MRMMPPGGAATVAGALVAAMALSSAVDAQQRDPYPATLQFGTGLINIPTAWVSPLNSDVWIQTSGKVIEHFVEPSEMNLSTRWNSNISIDTHWLGRFSVGVSAYSQNPEWGFFGQVLLIKPDQFANVPSIALGVRNVGKYDNEDRLLVGHDIRLDPTDSTYSGVTGVFYDGFSTSPTIYGVATQEFGLGTSWSGSLSLGYGSGLFSDDGGLGDDYNLKGQLAEGLFLGGRVVARPSTNTLVTLMVENDGWDWNAGIVGDWRGLTLGIYGTELEEGSRDPSKCPNIEALCRIYNYAKLNVSLGYSGNIIDISRGVLLRTRISELEREQQRLRSEIASRERRIAGLETALRRAQAGELAEIARRRQELEQQIQEEREAIRRATERLEQLERQRQPPPPANPPGSASKY
ncbi:MAG TPA: hypothetical protein VK922_14500 [Gemmatimonadaceae bacterium]|nr:hypothetical protein [Gemmatimonadaceae bacterium]